MRKYQVLFVMVVFALVSLACSGSTKATPEKVEDVVATMEAAITQTARAASISGEAQPADVEIAAESATEEPQEEPTAVPQTRFNVGDIVRLEDIQLIVTEITEVPGSQFNMPKEGYRFIKVGVQYENVGENSQIVSTSDFVIFGADGTQYDNDLMALVAVGGESIISELLPGAKKAGVVAFELPIDSSGFLLIYKVSFWDERIIEFNTGL